MTMQSLPLDTLILSKLNVRHTERDADIAALAEDIAARGLKQNLVVVPAHFTTGEAHDVLDSKDRWADKWEVIAGGRRYQAMQLLVADGRLPADHPVPCLLEEREDASETSLSENLHKVSMNPADEFAAFNTIVINRETKHRDTRDAAIVYCAKRFGKTHSHVQGRLRLATLAPEILDALRADAISLDAAKAYALTTDHDLQRKVFAQIEKDSWRTHDAKAIRSEVRAKTLPLDAPLVTFVGLVTYQAEGGRIESEMFMGAEGQQRVVDVPLLEKLAKTIVGAAIPALVKTDGFKSGLYAPGVGYSAKWPKAPEGYEKAWDYGAGPTKAQMKKSIAVYSVNGDGTGLQRAGRFKPAEPKAPSEHRTMTPEEQAEHFRKVQVDKIAARLAVMALNDDEDREIWPESNWISPINPRHGEDIIEVALLFRVTTAERDAQRTAAEVEYDAQLMAKAAADAKLDDADSGAAADAEMSEA